MNDHDIEQRLRSDGDAWRTAGGLGSAGQYDQAVAAAMAETRGGRHRVAWLSTRTLAAAVSAAALVVAITATAVFLNSAQQPHPHPEAPSVGTTFPVPTVSVPSCRPGSGPQGLSARPVLRGEPMPTYRSRARQTAALALVAAAAAGCTSSSLASTHTTSASAASTPSASSSPPVESSSPVAAHTTRSVSAPSSSHRAAPTHTSPAAHPSSAPASSSSATNANCAGSQLSTKSVPVGGGDGNDAVELVFTNTGSSTCVLYGYPGAALLDKQGKQIVQAERTLGGYIADCGCNSPPHVKLAPGGKASTALEGSSGGGDECLQGVNMLVTPPNTTTSVRLSGSVYACHVQIHPVIAGTGGGGHN